VVVAVTIASSRRSSRNPRPWSVMVAAMAVCCVVWGRECGRSVFKVLCV
jgi:hypothetical protein